MSTNKTTFADFYEEHAYSAAGNEAMKDVVKAVSNSAAGKDFAKFNAEADELEAKAAELRSDAEEKFRAVIRALEAELNANSDKFTVDDFETATEAVSEVVHGYGYANGLEVDYSFEGDLELWEASTC